MFIDTYKEFSLYEKVRIKNEVVQNYLISSYSIFMTSGQSPIIDYVLRENSLITISGIEYNPNLIIQANFYFKECDGGLIYGQFLKCFPTIYILTSNDFNG